MNRKHTTVSFPLDLAERIDRVLSKGGYQSRSDFVRDAVRRLLKELEPGAKQ
ncbi:MAG: ribbon-helix-helix domain-containing protein [Candidatus Bathyarchaeia archaeon]